MGVITDCFQADYVARRHGAVGLDVGGPASSGDERPHLRTRERFLALSDLTQESCVTRAAKHAHRHPQTVMKWLHRYNMRGPKAPADQRTGSHALFGWTLRPAYRPKAS
jgi:hypothetical protein